LRQRSANALSAQSSPTALLLLTTIRQRLFFSLARSYHFDADQLIASADNELQNVAGFQTTQIILEQESRGQNLLPVNFLRQLIRFYGDSMGRLVPSYLDMSIETLAREQERFRKQMAETWGSAAGGGPFASVPFGAAPFGAAALEAMQEQTRHNLALFEKAMSLWSPFTAASRGPGAHVSNGNGDAGKVPAPTVRSSEPTPTKDDGDLAAMREQLAAMQRQLDRLSRGE